MRSAGAVLGVLILAAATAVAGQSDKGAATTGATPASGSEGKPETTTGNKPGSTPASPATTLMPDLDRFMGLQREISTLEKKVDALDNKLKPRDPTVEQWMWRALAVLSGALALVWIVGKVVERSDSERATKVAIWKELAQAARPLAPAPQPALNDFVTRLEAASGEIREVTVRAEDALRAVDARLDELSPRVAELEKKLQAAAKRAGDNG